jgi:hypothetical protein
MFQSNDPFPRTTTFAAPSLQNHACHAGSKVLELYLNEHLVAALFLPALRRERSLARKSSLGETNFLRRQGW